MVATAGKNKRRAWLSGPSCQHCGLASTSARKRIGLRRPQGQRQATPSTGLALQLPYFKMAAGHAPCGSPASRGGSGLSSRRRHSPAPFRPGLGAWYPEHRRREEVALGCSQSAAPAAMLAAVALLFRRGAALSRLPAPSARLLAAPAAVLPAHCYSHEVHESDEEFDARWVTYFNKPDIDAWELRKGMNTLVNYDLVPEPKIIDAALRACRRLNDFASAVRILEAIKDKAGPHKEIYPYVIQELRPTLNELGISTPEELGLDKV
ncbi:cytochrome c oxidase subunit 5A, mitochondrial [Alligator mississippiensis]|uniref:cytochrome c oxidase subunit 5A, mitochondrial n=1 Tax=Alligator mississippiensis TaxID=8496 RepID=UPI00090702BB|nr:cytochrome c oxidase subunit 5A, mitochondrial [Alligator mississippiensis]